MKPNVNRSTFGAITIDGAVYERDIIIRLNGQVKKRKKKLSKAVYGTSHTISLVEARHVYEKGPNGSSLARGNMARSRCQMRRPTISSAKSARWSCCPWAR